MNDDPDWMAYELGGDVPAQCNDAAMPEALVCRGERNPTPDDRREIAAFAEYLHRRKGGPPIVARYKQRRPPPLA